MDRGEASGGGVREDLPAWRCVAAGRRGAPRDLEVDIVTLNHLFGIVPGDVASKRNATSAAIHPHDGRM